MGGYWLRAVTIGKLLMGGCGLSHESAEDGCKGMQLGEGFSVKNQYV